MHVARIWKLFESPYGYYDGIMMDINVCFVTIIVLIIHILCNFQMLYE